MHKAVRSGYVVGYNRRIICGGRKMKVKEVLAEAARLIGDDELKKYLTSTTAAANAELNGKTESLLSCYNAILHETAVNYLPIRATVIVGEGRTDFSALGFSVLGVEGVFGADGEDVSYKVFPTHLVAAGGAAMAVIDIVPDEAALTDDFAYDGTRIGKTVFACGVASEYCLISGRYSEAENFNKKYCYGVEFAPAKRGRIMRAAKRWGI